MAFGGILEAKRWKDEDPAPTSRIPNFATSQLLDIVRPTRKSSLVWHSKAISFRVYKQ